MFVPVWYFVQKILFRDKFVVPGGSPTVLHDIIRCTSWRNALRRSLNGNMASRVVPANRKASLLFECNAMKILSRNSLFIKRWNWMFSRNCTKLSEMKVLIRSNTVISRNHLTPEIALHLITSSCPLWKSRPEDCPFSDPFWAFYWPGGQAVTRFILDNPHIVKGMKVIDIGSGSGASAIAAYKCGAKLAIANDIDPVAGVAAEMNASLNDAFIQISFDNHIKEDPLNKLLPWDVIILGDLFYDAEIAQRVMTWAKKCSSLGVFVLVGDPGRYAFTVEANSKKSSKNEDFTRKSSPTNSLCLMKSYPLPEESCLENNGFSHASVWKLC